MSQPDAASAAGSPSWAQRHPLLKKNLIILAVALVAEIILLSFNAHTDSFLWHATRWFMGDQDSYQWPLIHAGASALPDAPWWRTVPPPFGSRLYHETEGTWRVLRDVAVPAEVILIMLLIWIYDPAGWRALLLVLGGILGAGVVDILVKSVCGRQRPDMNVYGGDNVWNFMRGFHSQTDLSFPSGHAVVAFSVAAALCYLSPRGRVLFVTVAALVGFSRVVMQAHFYSDVIAGATIGWVCSSTLIDWLGPRLEIPQRKLSPATQPAS
ncbi:MAG TPA: phosphatase PAP2 family protein [Phycisphaerae bacterium]|nr:phosphatase PAP2 family protein [Phycisphaerae bacterium]